MEALRAVVGQTHPREPRAPSSEVLSDMPKPPPDGRFQTAPVVALLEQAGVSKLASIRVAGPGALAVVLGLRRHDYDQAGCVCAGEGSPHEEPDVVLVAQPCGELDLKRLLSVGRQVRPGGAFIFQLKAGPGASLTAVEWLLQHAGFTLERHLGSSRGALILARRRAFAPRQAA